MNSLPAPSRSLASLLYPAFITYWSGASKGAARGDHRECWATQCVDVRTGATFLVKMHPAKGLPLRVQQCRNDFMVRHSPRRFARATIGATIEAAFHSCSRYLQVHRQQTINLLASV